MCRLLGILASQEVWVLDALVDSPKSLLAQSRASESELQKDGWGIGFYDKKGAPHITKSPFPVYEEPRRFRETAQRVKGRICVAHIRKASNPKGLSRERLLGEENSQPFSHGQILFAHNGTLYEPDALVPRLGPFKKSLRGVNDSQVYFWIFMKHYKRKENIPVALRACARELRASSEKPFSALNVIVSDGKSLNAMCLYTGIPGKALCSQDWPYWNMAYRQSPHGLLMSSEPTANEKGWMGLENGEMLVARIVSGKVRFKKEKI